MPVPVGWLRLKHRAHHILLEKSRCCQRHFQRDARLRSEERFELLRCLVPEDDSAGCVAQFQSCLSVVTNATDAKFISADTHLQLNHRPAVEAVLVDNMLDRRASTYAL